MDEMDRMNSRSRALIQVIILCATAFGCFLYLTGSRYVSNNGRGNNNMRTPPPRPNGISWLDEHKGEAAYGEPAPDQGYLLVHMYGGQQGAGVESLVSLQVSGW